MKSEWKTCKAEDFIEFNPRLTIRKGETATKVSMDKLQPFTKAIPEVEQAAFSGGSKFCNGDTIMARITPCLENGKTAFVDNLQDGEVAFGSTEFIVMRARPGISDPQFVYYLAISPFFRDVAIKSMVGSSGRQRVQQNVLNGLVLTVPPFDVQRRIGSFLAKLEDKIELNRKINRNLERQAQAFFESWFTGEREINGCLADICQYSKEKVAVSSLDLESYYSTENMLPGKAGATQAVSLPTTTQTTKCNVGDILVSNIRPYFKKIVYCHADCGCSTDVLCFAPKKQGLSAYLFFLLYADSFFDFMVAGSKGTKMPRGDKQQIMMYPVYVPSDEELTGFNSFAQPTLKQIQLNREENKRLIALRDTLLPKLMAGEIDI